MTTPVRNFCILPQNVDINQPIVLNNLRQLPFYVSLVPPGRMGTKTILERTKFTVDPKMASLSVYDLKPKAIPIAPVYSAYSRLQSSDLHATRYGVLHQSTENPNLDMDLYSTSGGPNPPQLITNSLLAVPVVNPGCLGSADQTTRDKNAKTLHEYTLTGITKQNRVYVTTLRSFFDPTTTRADYLSSEFNIAGPNAEQELYGRFTAILLYMDQTQDIALDPNYKRDIETGLTADEMSSDPLATLVNDAITRSKESFRRTNIARQMHQRDAMEIDDENYIFDEDSIVISIDNVDNVLTHLRDIVDQKISDKLRIESLKQTITVNISQKMVEQMRVLGRLPQEEELVETVFQTVPNIENEDTTVRDSVLLYLTETVPSYLLSASSNANLLIGKMMTDFTTSADYVNTGHQMRQPTEASGIQRSDKITLRSREWIKTWKALVIRNVFNWIVITIDKVVSTISIISGFLQIPEIWVVSMSQSELSTSTSYADTSGKYTHVGMGFVLASGIDTHQPYVLALLMVHYTNYDALLFPLDTVRVPSLPPSTTPFNLARLSLTTAAAREKETFYPIATTAIVNGGLDWSVTFKSEITANLTINGITIPGPWQRTDNLFKQTLQTSFMNGLTRYLVIERFAMVGRFMASVIAQTYFLLDQDRPDTIFKPSSLLLDDVIPPFTRADFIAFKSIRWSEYFTFMQKYYSQYQDQHLQDPVTFNSIVTGLELEVDNTIQLPDLNKVTAQLEFYAPQELVAIHKAKISSAVTEKKNIFDDILAKIGHQLETSKDKLQRLSSNYERDTQLLLRDLNLLEKNAAQLKLTNLPQIVQNYRSKLDEAKAQVLDQHKDYIEQLNKYLQLVAGRQKQYLEALVQQKRKGDFVDLKMPDTSRMPEEPPELRKEFLADHEARLANADLDVASMSPEDQNVYLNNLVKMLNRDYSVSRSTRRK